MKWLLVLSVLMNMGFYALIPYLTLHVTGSYGWTLAMAGLMLGVRQFSQQGIAFIGGMVADRFGYKLTMILGIFARATGFSAFAFCTETWQFFAAAILSGLGGSLFEPAMAACYSILAPQDIRKEVFAMRSVLNNISMVGSQLIGTALAMFDFYWLSLFAGAAYYVCILFVMIGIPPIEAGNRSGKVTEGIHLVFRDRAFLMFCAIMIGYYYIYMQIFLAIPKYVEDVLDSKTAVGIVLATVSVMVILFQMKITKLLAGQTQHFTLIGFGTLLMSIGMFLFSFSNTLWMIMIDVCIFSLGTMISNPYLVDMVPRFAPREHIGAYFGFSGYSIAIGGSIGTVLGGWMYDQGQVLHMSWLPWGFCLLIGMIVAWAMYRMERSAKVSAVAKVM
ncbi:MDR family MFS transporter [Brevibacillus dissolubilis]|uniref:MDR family MFS transporter n=1 Tax=Brevibacillus dissolubilis TaxID=1844116 RepID=UPI0021004C84|nr:MFS transporter [Brevibacillus dissolubilis]